MSFDFYKAKAILYAKGFDEDCVPDIMYKENIEVFLYDTNAEVWVNGHVIFCTENAEHLKDLEAYMVKEML